MVCTLLTIVKSVQHIHWELLSQSTFIKSNNEATIDSKIRGDQESFYPRTTAKWILDKIPSQELVVVAGTYLSCPLEEPSAVTEATVSFLDTSGFNYKPGRIKVRCSELLVNEPCPVGVSLMLNEDRIAL